MRQLAQHHIRVLSSASDTVCDNSTINEPLSFKAWALKSNQPKTYQNASRQCTWTQVPVSLGLTCIQSGATMMCAVVQDAQTQVQDWYLTRQGASLQRLLPCKVYITTQRQCCSGCARYCVALSAAVAQGVKDSADLRKAVEEVQPENVKLGLRLSQSKAIYAAFKVSSRRLQRAYQQPREDRSMVKVLERGRDEQQTWLLFLAQASAGSSADLHGATRSLHRFCIALA